MRHLVTIQTIKEIQPIENADKIERVKVKEWWVVTQKDNFKVGDLCVFFEIDSFLPFEDKKYSFLQKGNSQKRMLVDGVEKIGFRLKTIKLKGQLSQGLVLPISEFLTDISHDVFEHPENHIDEDISELLGVIKYEQPVPAELSGKIKGFFPTFIPKTDEERIQNMSDVLSGFYVTEKVDGCSVTFYKKDGIFGVCSRNLELLDTEGNTQWRIARELNLPERLSDNFAIQGELVGEGIQKNPLKINGQTIYFYNVYKINTFIDSARGMFLNFEDFKGFIESLSLKTAPIIDENFVLPKSVDVLLEYANGKSLINPNVAREGIVVRPKIESTYKGRRLSFKAISNEYLLKEE